MLFSPVRYPTPAVATQMALVADPLGAATTAVFPSLLCPQVGPVLVPLHSQQ